MPNSDDGGMRKSHEIMFQAVFEGIAFIKKQQWIIVGYALAAQAALYLVGKEITNPYIRGFFVPAAIAGSVYAGLVLNDLWKGLDNYRAQLDWLCKANFSKEEREGLRISEEDARRNEWVFSVLYGVLAVSAGVTIAGLMFSK